LHVFFLDIRRDRDVIQAGLDITAFLFCVWGSVSIVVRASQ
jgi:hypothetical protein